MGKWKENFNEKTNFWFLFSFILRHILLLVCSNFSIKVGVQILVLRLILTLNIHTILPKHPLNQSNCKDWKLPLFVKLKNSLAMWIVTRIVLNFIKTVTAEFSKKQQLPSANFVIYIIDFVKDCLLWLSVKKKFSH